MKRTLTLCIGLALFTLNSFAQESGDQPMGNNPSWGTKKTIIVGGAEAVFMSDTGQSNFRNIKFHLSPMIKLSDKMFMINEIEIETKEGSSDFGLEQVQLCYEVAPNATLYAGRFLMKFGHYRGMIGEGYINRFPTDPVGFGDGGIGPMVETGAGVVGGFQLGMTKLNYDIYVSNGPQLLTGMNGQDPAMAGQFEYESYMANNKSKAIGGRIGFLPLSNSALELGLSVLKKTKTGDAHTQYENVGATWMAMDANYFTTINPLKSTLRLNAEYKSMNVDNTTYQMVPGDDSTNYTFDNNSTCYYVQASLRPTGSSKPLLSNLEVAVRYSEFSPAEGAMWGGMMLGGKTVTQTAIGLNYWLAWDCILKLTYQMQKYPTTSSTNAFLAQLIYRF